MALPPGVVVRPLRESDSIPDLTALLHRAYAPLAARGLRFLATHQDDAMTRKRCAQGECLVAEFDGRVVATITWRRPWTGSEVEWYRRPEVAIFAQYAVEPSLGARGIGGALLDDVECRVRAAGYTELACDTAEPATDLISMYERRGFRRVGVTKWDNVNYPSVVLSKPL